MNKSGAWLTQYALEQLGITHTFGIPGVQNAEIYDQLNQSEQITPLLVNHEMNAAFMADAVSRSAAGSVGTMLIVSGSGVTHACSGIAEAYLAGIPLLVIAGASGNEQSGYPSIDAKEILKHLTKAIYSISDQQHIVETLFTAYRVATSDRPGPVFVEIPLAVQMLSAAIDEPLPLYDQKSQSPNEEAEVISNVVLNNAAAQLLQAESPGIIVGWGAVDAHSEIIALAQQIGAPVCTTLSGVSSFPAQHPLHAGMIFGPAAVPSAENAFKDCDCLLAIGTNLNEADTAGGSAELPENIIYITNEQNSCDEPETVTALHGNIQQIATDLLYKLQEQQPPATSRKALVDDIAIQKALFKKEWLGHNSKGLVNPAVFFDKLRAAVSDDAIVITDDGLHTYLAAELMPISSPRSFISPSSSNAMGYCVPAVNAVKLVNPDKQVIGIVGDGAMLMSGMEALTAVRENLGTIYCIFNDGKLSRINHSQPVSDSQTTCTQLGNINWGAFADSIECGYIPVRHNNEIEVALRHALETASHNQPVILDINIDYSRRSNYAQGVEKTNAARFLSTNKLGMLGRAIVRKLTG
ncbi:Acetolactate synthase isozyme 3 large subunit [Gammaproteobacteria bacterium MOLA455]|nr:Acetolactate synthase isozyme 3 large subunit [Gammaproteobacteria bacterium MOLA455]